MSQNDHHSANEPRKALLGANKYHQEGLIGATWLAGVHIHFCCHQMITQPWPKGPQGVSRSPKIGIGRQPMHA